MMSWPERIAFSTWGITVSSYPIIPGNNSSPLRIFWMRFFLNSSLTESNLYPLSRNSPIVRGRVVMVIQFCVTFLGSWHRGMHIWDRGQLTNPVLHNPHCTINMVEPL